MEMTQLDSRGRVIDADIRVRPEPPQGAARYVTGTTLARLEGEAALIPRRRPSRALRSARAVRAVFLTVMVSLALVRGLASLAPSAESPRAVPASQFSGACGYYGPAVSAQAVASSGGEEIYNVICARESLPMTVAR